MVRKCANPECETEFKYFRGGRLYEFTVGASGVCKDLSEAPPKGASRELFWLCHECKQQFSLECSGGRINVVPRQSRVA